MGIAMDNELVQVLIDAGAIPDAPYLRVIIDIEFEHPVRVYTKQYGDARLCDVDWTAAGELSIVNQPPPSPPTDP